MTAKDFSCNFVFVASCVHGYTKVLGKRTTACWCKQAIYLSTWQDIKMVNRRLICKIVSGKLTTTCGRNCKDIVICNEVDHVRESSVNVQRLLVIIKKNVCDQVDHAMEFQISVQRLMAVLKIDFNILIYLR